MKHLLYISMAAAMLLCACTKPDVAGNEGESSSEASISLDIAEATVSAEMQVVTINVSCSGDWSVAAETLVDWCSVAKTSSSTATVTVLENKTDDPRTAKYVFKCGKNSEVFTITQKQVHKLTASTGHLQTSVA